MYRQSDNAQRRERYANDHEYRSKRLAYVAEWRKNNPAKVRKHFERGKAVINSAKDKPCADCGIKYDPCVMDFDHVRGEKLMTVGPMTGYKLEKIVDEIAKCDIVCSNCHRMRTKIRRDTKRLPIE